MSFSVFERKILQDNKSGSSEILKSVLDYNLKSIKEINSNPNLLEHLLKFNEAVVDKFSAMAIVANGLNRVNHIISSSISPKKSMATLSNSLERFIKNIAKIDKNIIENSSILFPKIKGKVTIATYSNSGLVKKVIRKYSRLINKIYLSEARPANEGREMAKYIAGIGVEVILSADVHLPGLLSKVNLLLLGADSVGKDCFINKIGSKLLLREARRMGVKSAVLFESLKIKILDVNTSLKADYKRREIWPHKDHKNIRVINQYFEIIDNLYIDKFISDLGVDTPKSLKRKIKAENLL